MLSGRDSGRIDESCVVKIQFGKEYIAMKLFSQMILYLSNVVVERWELSPKTNKHLYLSDSLSLEILGPSNNFDYLLFFLNLFLLPHEIFSFFSIHSMQ